MRVSWRLSLAGLVLLGGLLALPGGAAVAQDATPPAPVTADQVNRVAKQLYCPVCENIPLDVCPTQACIQWRATIREKLEQGWTDQQILDYFVTQYGERVLARPSTRGINILVWVIPPAVLVLGAFFLWRYLRAISRPSSQDPQGLQRPLGSARPEAGPEAAPADEYVRRLEQELKRRI
jgi:cytochrome c-type biogenesis protein CcmH